jgi:hypothetical protein
MAWGTYMLRKFVCVGFHSSQGVGAHAVMRSYHEISHQDTKTQNYTKGFIKKKLGAFVPWWQ